MSTPRPIVFFCVALLSSAAYARDPRPGEPDYVPIGPSAKALSSGHIGRSPFNPPEASDSTFVVDTGWSGLDTACTFRSGGPLVFQVQVDRAFASEDVQRLKEEGLISEYATLRMPAFDVDIDYGGSDYAPEADRVFFNGNLVPEEFLSGANGVWKLNAFQVPIEWVNFRSIGSTVPGRNEVRIDIDTANAEEVWCTSIDWAALSFSAVRPVVFAHGILSDSSVWNSIWVPELSNLGVPVDAAINPSMGNLDSIQNNAGKIAAAVEAAKSQWGVDKVNLVTHSKGGLDARHFVETADSVETLVQLGTPNGGSPLADFVQGSVLIAVGPLSSYFINSLAGPAGVQLTTPYMTLYNAYHDFNEDVSYNALAGRYYPDCFFCVNKALEKIVGPGDTIVPVTSVFALPYTRNISFESVGDDEDATHTQIEKSLAVFNAVSPTVVVLSQAKSASDSAGASSRSATSGGTISSGQVQTKTIMLDVAPAMISMLYPSGGLNLTLISPSGRRIDRVVAAADPSIEFTEGDILGGNQAAYLLSSAELGEWKTVISAISGSNIDYAIGAWMDASASAPADVRLEGAFARQSISTGEALIVQATVRDRGIPVLRASAKARVGHPDGSNLDLALHDDGLDGDDTAGDGIYSATHRATQQSGLYRVVFVAEGTNAAGRSFSRETFNLATVSAGTSRFTAFREMAKDTNGNGYYDELVVEADVDATVQGPHRILAVLADSAGHEHLVSVNKTLVAGSNTVPLVFDGKDIYRDRTDGPYVLSSIRLAQEGNIDLLPTDQRVNAHTSRPYTYSQFEHERIELVGTGTAKGVDENANGLFDRLDVALDVELAQAGYYQWTAQLTDRTGAKIGFYAGNAYLNAGRTVLRMTFAGEAIGKNGEDGPYDVTDLLVHSGRTSLVAAHAFAASPFRASQFEGYVRDTTPPVLELSADPGQMWPPNHRMVPVQVQVNVHDNLDPKPVVTLVSVVSNEADNGLGDGDFADDIQKVELGTDDRELMLRAERSGKGTGRVYTLTYQARDASGNVSTSTVTVSVPLSRQ